jgi:hypothetical protein
MHSCSLPSLWLKRKRRKRGAAARSRCGPLRAGAPDISQRRGSGAGSWPAPATSPSARHAYPRHPARSSPADTGAPQSAGPRVGGPRAHPMAAAARAAIRPDAIRGMGIRRARFAAGAAPRAATRDRSPPGRTLPPRSCTRTRRAGGGSSSHPPPPPPQATFTRLFGGMPH